MINRPVIALDVMGGDGGPSVVVAGAELAKARDRALCFRLFGREADIRRELAAAPQVAGDSVFVQPEIAVAATAKPRQAIRHAREIFSAGDHGAVNRGGEHAELSWGMIAGAGYGGEEGGGVCDQEGA